jgi:hypothetical protein
MKPSMLVEIVVCLLLWTMLVLLVAVMVRLAIKTFARAPDEPNAESANARARELLQALLSDDEFAQLTTLGYIDVASPGNAERIYRIPLEDGMVRVYESGKETLRLCIQPVHPLPRYDVIAMHKLMIEGNEQTYLSRANWFAPLKSWPGPLNTARTLGL